MGHYLRCHYGVACLGNIDMTPEELREKVAKALIDSDPTISGYHSDHIAIKSVAADAAIRVVLEAALEVAEAHAKDSEQVTTLYLMGRHYAAKSIATGLVAFLPQDKQEDAA